MRRATVIKDAFVEGGTESSRIKTFSKGKSEPLVPNINEENRRQNRRVVVVIED
jgi:outer membrane protein OmpA-like peptidoglycan-associated protein